MIKNEVKSRMRKKEDVRNPTWEIEGGGTGTMEE
jgi:hypothetical protein